MSKTRMAPSREIGKNLASRRGSALAQDLGLAVYLFSVLAAAMTIAAAETRRTEYVAMFALMSASALLAGYRFRYLAAGLTGLQMLGFAVYTLFQSLTQGEKIFVWDYVWAVLPLLNMGGMQLFVGAMYRIEKTNEELSRQMESVVLLDALTGLYNLRALYIDLQRQMAYSQRRKNPLTLMVIRLRYADELHSMLSREHYGQVIRRLGEILSDNVRLEDRCYAVDPDKGEFAVMLICDKAGAEVVRSRIQGVCANRETFSGIIDKAIRVDLRIAFAEYEEGMENAIEFKHKADSELQYDV